MSSMVPFGTVPTVAPEYGLRTSMTRSRATRSPAMRIASCRMSGAFILSLSSRRGAACADEVLAADAVERRRDHLVAACVGDAISLEARADPETFQKIRESRGGTGEIAVEDARKHRIASRVHPKRALEHERQRERAGDSVRQAVMQRHVIGDRMREGGLRIREREAGLQRGL